MKIKSKGKELEVLNEKNNHIKNLLKKIETDRDYLFLKRKYGILQKDTSELIALMMLITVIFEEIKKDKEFLQEIVTMNY